MVLANLLASYPWWAVEIPAPVALGAIALIGYVFGRRTRQLRLEMEASKDWRELRRARDVAGELEQIASGIRKDLAAHRASVSRFRERVSQLSGEQTDDAWNQLRGEADEVLQPTSALAMQIARAYDEIRQQTVQLMAFARSPRDPASAREMLEEQLHRLCQLAKRGEDSFSLAIIQIDHYQKIVAQEGQPYADRLLKKLVALLRKVMRTDDLVTRCRQDELILVLPHTSLKAARAFGKGLKELVEHSLPLSITGGLVVGTAEDQPGTVLARADQALQAAQAEGGGCLFVHDGLEPAPIDQPEEMACDDRSDQLPPSELAEAEPELVLN